MFSKTLLIFLIIGLSGCVAGQNIRLRYKPEVTAVTAPISAPVTLVVTDKREYVVNGKKRPQYLGHYRAGFGNTWDVVTYKNVPLADQLSMDVQEELQSLGFARGKSQSGKTVTIVIREWNFDALSNGRFWYDIQLNVTASNGAQLFTTHVKDEKIIKGSVMMGAKKAMAKQIPIIYGEIIRALIRENPGTMAALRT